MRQNSIKLLNLTMRLYVPMYNIRRIILLAKMNNNNNNCRLNCK